MFSAKHAVFIGAGKLPEELRAVLLKRHGQPQSDLTVTVPRLLATFDNAIDAERVAGQLQRQRFRVLVSGPEQPKLLDTWLVISAIEPRGNQWQVSSTDWSRTLDGPQIEAITMLNWRPEEGAATRVVLMKLQNEERLLFLMRRRWLHHHWQGPILKA